jgi:hypothetical protein
MAFVGVLALAAACSDDGVDRDPEDGWQTCAVSPGDVSHPTGGSDVVLRIGVVGGLPLPAPMPDELPQLTLYGDGRLLAVDGSPEHLVPGLVERRLTEPEVQAVLHAAERACLLERDAFLQIPESYDVPGVAFVTDAGDASHATTVVGLGWSELDDAVPADQVGQRRALLDVHAAAAGLLEAGTSPARVDRLGVFVIDAEGPPADETSPVVTWPLRRSLATLGAPPQNEESGVRCDVVRGTGARALLAAVADLAWGQRPTWTDDGRWFLVSLRPMLPDELRCGTLVQ